MSNSKTKEVLIAYIFDNNNSPPTEAHISKNIPILLEEKGQRLSLPTECTSLLIPQPGCYAVVYIISEKHKAKFDEQCELLPEQIFDKVTASINPKYAADDSVVFTKCLRKCGINQPEKNGNVKGYLFQISYLNTLLAEEYISQSDDEDRGEDELQKSIETMKKSIIKSSKEMPTSEQQKGAAGSTESDFVTENSQSSKLLKSDKLNASSTGIRPKPGDINSSDVAGTVSRSRQNSVDEIVQEHSANDNDSMKSQYTHDSQQPEDTTMDNMLSTRKRNNVDDLRGKDAVETNSPPSVQNNVPTGGQDSRIVTFGQFNYFDNIYGGDTTRGLRLEYSGKREYKVFGTNLRKVDLWNNILKDFKEVRIEARKSHLTASIFKDKCCKMKEKFSLKDIGFFLDELLMNVHIIGPNTEVETHIPGVYHDLEVPIPKEYRKRRDLNGAMASGGAQNTADIRTSKKEALKEKDKCPVCFDDIDITDAGVTVLDKCKHAFCKDCIDQAFKVKPVCPTCGALYGKLTGTQPADGEMFVTESHYQHLPGYGGYGTITINYTFPDGRQGSEHPDPGKPYRGIRRTAYLPNNREGKKVAKLLDEAFKARIVFTIGRSTTTGKEGKITWNDIHHKTSMSGGPQKFGYPDPDYLTRVQGELADKGFK